MLPVANSETSTFKYKPHQLYVTFINKQQQENEHDVGKVLHFSEVYKPILKFVPFQHTAKMSALYKTQFKSIYERLKS